MQRRLTRLTGALACAALAAGTAAFTGTASSSAAEDPASRLNLRAASRIVTYSYDGWVYTGLGLRLTAPTDPVEIYSSRPSYAKPIQSVWRNAPGGPRTLPEGSMSSFTGLDKFLRIRIVRVSDGRLMRSRLQTTCLNGYSQRTDPDAPATSPYPYGCPYNPYTVGSVMGIQGGHSIALMEEWGSQFRLQPGRYDVTTRITPPYAGFFGITELGRTATTRLVVRDGDDNGMSLRTAEGASRTASAELAEPAAAEPRSAGSCAPDVPKPDLRSLPAWDIGLNGKGTVLRFAANVWNAGSSPLVVDGFRSDNEDHMDAYQYFFDENDEQLCYERVGEMHWHEANHQHWHFEDFAQYSLVDAPGPGGNEVLSEKQSFCLANTDAIDYTVPGAEWHPENTDLGTACGGQEAQSVRQVLSSGSGDTYYQYRQGQAFRIGDLPDGVYWIAVRANRSQQLVESDTANNDSYRRVRIGTNARGERFVRVPQVGLVDENGMFGGFF